MCLSVTELQEPAESLDDTWEYNMTSSTWTDHSAGVGAGPSRRYASSIVWSDLLSRAVLFGGSYWQEKLYYSDTWLYSFHSHTWSEARVLGSPPPPRFAHVAAIYNHCMYVYGGANDQSNRLNDLFVLHLDVFKWDEILTSTPPGRAWMASAVFSNVWVIVGGASNRTDRM